MDKTSNPGKRAKKTPTFTKIKYVLIVFLLIFSGLNYFAPSVIRSIESLFTSDSEDQAVDLHLLANSVQNLKASEGHQVAKVGNAQQSDKQADGMTEPQQLNKSPNIEVAQARKGTSPANLDFVTANDYRAVLAASRMLSNAVNPEAESRWLELRLSARAQRERTNIANSQLAFQKAKLETAQALQQTEELQSVSGVENKLASFSKLYGASKGDDDNGGTGGIYVPEVKLISYIKGDDSSQSSIKLKVGSEYYDNLSSGHSTGLVIVQNLNDKSSCADLLIAGVQKRRVCG